MGRRGPASGKSKLLYIQVPLFKREYDRVQRFDTGNDMSDYTTATGHDTTIVEIAAGNQVRYWCEALGCTEAQLRESVQAVGNSPEDVRAYLEVLSQRGVF